MTQSSTFVSSIHTHTHSFARCLWPRTRAACAHVIRDVAIHLNEYIESIKCLNLTGKDVEWILSIEQTRRLQDSSEVRKMERKNSKMNIFIKKNMKMKCVAVYINTAQIDQTIYSTLVWHVIFLPCKIIHQMNLAENKKWHNLIDFLMSLNCFYACNWPNMLWVDLTWVVDTRIPYVYGDAWIGGVI